MSVINQVLQQLEQRRATPAAAAADVGVPLAPVRPQRPRRLAVISVLGVGAVSVAAFGDWPQLFQSPAKAVQAAAPMAAVDDRPPVASPAVAAARPASEPAVAAAPADRPGRSRQRAKAQPSEAASTSRPAVLAAAAPVGYRVPGPRPLAPPLPSLTKRAAAETPQARAQVLAQQATESAQAGHRQLAIERAIEALKLDPALHVARHLAAALMAESGRAGEAEALLREGLGEHTPPAAAALLARLVAERGDSDGALALLDRHRLNDADAQGLRGALYARRGDPARARAAYEAALAQRPQTATWWLGLGIALEAEQQAPDARLAYERARTLGLAEPELAAYADTRLRALAR